MPSDDDKVVAQLAEKFFSNGTNQHDPSTIAQRLESAIREAIYETRKQTLEMAAQRLWHGPGVLPCPTRNCDRVTDRRYACAELRRLAADSKDAAEGTEAR